VKARGFAVKTTEYRGSVLVNVCDEELEIRGGE